MKIIKKALSGILAASLIISNISVNSLFAIGNTEQNLIEENNLTDNYRQLIGLNDTEDEPSVDNWELGLVFYDSSVDNGKTALTTIDWDASDGDYREGVPRVITAQINYKNTSTVTTYNPGELEISIPNLIYNTSSSSGAQWKTEVIVGANDSTHDNYDWDFVTDIKPTNNQSFYTFKNATTIEENSNFEGSIQIVYTITPNGDNELAGYQGSFEPEKYEDECVHTYNTKLQAILKDITESNEVSFNYSRIYTHPWKYKEYSVTKTADKISSYDGLGSNAQDYIWVKYTFKASGLYGTGYPQIHATNFKFVDHLPKDCIVYNSSAKQISNEVSIPFSVTGFMTTYSSYIFVGYPKAIYNESNMYTKNEVELRGRYVNKKEEEILDSSIIDINLADFGFSYSGNLYGIQKYSPITTEMHYQAIIDKGFATDWHISPTARYTGNSMTIKIGDDLLYATGENGNVERLNDNDYYFSSITWNGNYFKNGNGTKIAAEKYDVELWIKYKNSEEYTLSSSFKNPSSSKTWNFSKEISSWYFIINDMEESIIPDGSNNYLINTTTVFKTLKNIPQKGTLHNFDYIQVYFKDINNNLLLQNPQTLDNYSTFVTKQEIAVFDIEEYGVYIQRDTASRNWNYHNVSQITHSLHARKKFNTITQDVENEIFKGSCSIGTDIYSTMQTWEKDYIEQYDEDYAVKGFKIYDLLPKGMELTSTKEQIEDALAINLGLSSKFYDKNFNQITTATVKSNLTSEVKITHNWNGTGRTKIEIIGTLKEPVYILYNGGSSPYRYCYFDYTFNYNISYDSFLEYGNVWTNYCYSDKLNEQKGINVYGVQDNGYYDADASDIDEDGDTSNTIAYTRGIGTITSVISTHQDVTKYVETDLSNFSTGIVSSNNNSEYTYKLRVRTGSADVTNLVIYDSIEEYIQDKNGKTIPAYGSKKHWNGEFLGVDTSYAENKGYKIKVYYSENKEAGNLYNEDGTIDSNWKEYTISSIPKVKALAFEYLDKDGNKAIIPAKSMTYVLIKMKSPADKTITSLAYNGCRTEWNALDDYNQVVDFITGINSNIVKVSLPNSREEDPSINISFLKDLFINTEKVQSLRETFPDDFKNMSDEDIAYGYMKLNKNDTFKFQISMKNIETEEIISILINNKNKTTVYEVPIGTYIITEADDIYFDLMSMQVLNSIEGITFEKVNNDYILTITSQALSEANEQTLEIKVNNIIEPDKPYEDKKEKENLFKF